MKAMKRWKIRGMKALKKIFYQWLYASIGSDAHCKIVSNKLTNELCMTISYCSSIMVDRYSLLTLSLSNMF